MINEHAVPGISRILLMINYHAATGIPRILLAEATHVFLCSSAFSAAGTRKIVQRVSNSPNLQVTLCPEVVVWVLRVQPISQSPVLQTILPLCLVNPCVRSYFEVQHEIFFCGPALPVSLCVFVCPCTSCMTCVFVCP